VGNRLFAGHGPNDCLVPFFPLYTHLDMHKVGSEFGYQCDLRQFPPPEPQTQPSPSPSPSPEEGGAIKQIAQCNVVLAALIMVAFAIFGF